MSEDGPSSHLRRGWTDMGDFVGGMLKYLRKHPVARITVAGHFAKMTKRGQGLLDLHSRRGSVDLAWLSRRTVDAGATPILSARMGSPNTAMEALDMCRANGIDIGQAVAGAAWATAAQTLGATPTALEIAVFDRQGALIARTPFRPVHS
jgi:cobalt-precorrin-5B (C1)-methyltransferase